MSIRAFAYLRVSGKGQVDGDGFPRQLAAIKSYAVAHDVKIVHVYREEGISGTKDLENRPALTDMMTALHADGTKLVLIENLGRLARDLMIQESILHDLTRNGFQLISVAEPDLCTDDPSRKLMRQVMGAFHEYEKTMIVYKLRGSRQRKKAKDGRCEGAKPFGHYVGESTILERMNALRKSGTGFDRIAVQLNEEGFKPRRGTQWYGSAVNKILSRG